MSRRLCLLLLMCIFLVGAPGAEACVGRVLTVGAVETAAGRVLAEMLAILINERTGTTVNTKYFPEAGALYSAVQTAEVGILIENTVSARQRLNLLPETDQDKAYAAVKEAYRKDLNLIWLSPFRFLQAAGPGQESRSAVVLSASVMTDFPGLPRLLNKLAEKMDDQDYAGLLRAVSSGSDPRMAAREFLNAKKLI